VAKTPPVSTDPTTTTTTTAHVVVRADDITVGRAGAGRAPVGKNAQLYFESIGGSSTHNADRLDENHNGVACKSLSDDGDNQDTAATSTGDDGSDATTSGNQVTDVPEGSAQTGGN
jgi:hypothetical protein